MSNLETIAHHYGQTAQLHKTVEECVECANAAIHYLNKPTPDNLKHLTEEMADVKVMMAQDEILLKNSDEVIEIMHQKVDRQIRRIMDGE